jgi:hypothetical protein
MRQTVSTVCETAVGEVAEASAMKPSLLFAEKVPMSRNLNPEVADAHTHSPRFPQI